MDGHRHEMDRLKQIIIGISARKRTDDERRRSTVVIGSSEIELSRRVERLKKVITNRNHKLAELKRDMRQLRDDPADHADIIIELQKRLKSALRQSTAKILKLQSKRPSRHKKTGPEIGVVAAAQIKLDQPDPPQTRAQSNRWGCASLLFE